MSVPAVPAVFHLRRARDLIDRCFAEPLDLDAMACAAGFSRYHFARGFRAAYGETPGQYLTRRRVERTTNLCRPLSPTGRIKMIKRLSHVCCYVLDQASAKQFYTDKLGFEVRSDVTVGGEFEGAGDGFRWLTVGPPDQPDVEIILADCGMRHDPETTEQLRALVAKGAMGAGVLATDDCQKTYEELAARGVVFTQEPATRPYGVEALFRDDSGNWFSLTQHTAGSAS